jgi:hypothetical protein
VQNPQLFGEHVAYWLPCAIDCSLSADAILRDKAIQFLNIMAPHFANHSQRVEHALNVIKPLIWMIINS